VKQNQLQGTTGSGQSGGAASPGLGELLSALIGKDMGSFLPTLQATTGQGGEGGSTKEGAPGAADAIAEASGEENGAGGADIDRATQIESLLSGVLALVAMKTASGATTDGTAPGPDGASEQVAAPALNGLVSSLAAPSGEGASSAPAKDGASKPADTTLAETLALLIFESLQALAATRDQAPPEAADSTESLLGKGDPGASGPLPPAQGKESGNGAAVNKASKEILEAAEAGQTAGGAGPKAPAVDAKGPFEQLLPGPADPADPSSGEKTAAQAADANNLTLVIRGPFSGGAQNQGTGGKSGTENGTADGEVGELKDDASVTIVKDLAALVEDREGNSSHDPRGDKEQSADTQGYPLTTGKDVSPGSAAAQEGQGTAPGQAGSTAAVERFEQIVGQLGSRPGSHDLVVKLDVGSEGSLVLGLKDLGQSVTVEVRASNQSMINLLTSQRDAIVRHLEGKDIHANIVIDPNASETPERREKREARQARAAANPGQDGDEAFGTFLERLV